MNKIFGLGLIGTGFVAGVFVGKNRRLVRRTGRRIEALKDDAKDLAQTAGEWIDKGKTELSRGRQNLEYAASAAATAYEKLTA